MTPTHPGAGDGTRNFCMLGMHFITDLPSQSYFSIPNILAFLQKFALQHFYNVINTSHSFLLQNLFLIREDLVNNFFLKVSSSQTILHVTWEAIFYYQGMILGSASALLQEKCTVDSSGCISINKGTYLTLPPA